MSGKLSVPSVSVRLGKTLVREVALVRGTMNIGRRPGNDLCIQDKTVSGHHAKIVWLHGPICIHDLGSTNGTFVNGTRISGPHELGDGDVISMGRHTLVFSEASSSFGQLAEETEVLGADDVKRLVKHARNNGGAEPGDTVPIPPEIRWVAQDAEGIWWGFERQPVQEANGWTDHQCGNYIRIGRGARSSHWADSLWRV